MKILIVTSEAAPFALTGKLGRRINKMADVLARQGHDVRVMLPCYGMLLDRENLATERELKVPIGQTTEPAALLSRETPQNVKYYFLQNSIYFDRSTDPSGLYVDPRTGRDYDDNAERFAYFSRGVAEALKALDWTPEAVLCNEWQTALVPMYLKTPYLYGRDPKLRDIVTALTIHNFAYQGIFQRFHELIGSIGFGWELTCSMSPLEFWGQTSYLKAGLVYSDILITPADTGLLLQTDQYSFGLRGTLLEQSAKLHQLTISKEFWPKRWAKAVQLYLDKYQEIRNARDETLQGLDQEHPPYSADRVFAGSADYYPRGYSKKYGERELSVPEHTFSLSAGSGGEIVSSTYEAINLHGPFANASGLILGIVGYVPSLGKEFGALLRSATWPEFLGQLDWLGREIQERRVVVTAVDGQGHIANVKLENQGLEVARRVREKLGFPSQFLGTPYCASDEWDVLLRPYRGEKLNWINIRGYNDPF
jgi:hypothetical protein